MVGQTGKGLETCAIQGLTTTSCISKIEKARQAINFDLNLEMARTMNYLYALTKLVYRSLSISDSAIIVDGLLHLLYFRLVTIEPWPPMP